MFAFARRPAPQQQHRLLGEPGISVERYERIAARLRRDRTTYSLPLILRAAADLKLQLSITTN